MLLLFFFTELKAQISEGGTPPSFTEKGLATIVPEEVMPPVNLDRVREEDVRDEAAGLPPRFGLRLNVNLNLDNSGLWETLPSGDRLWRLSIYSEGALSINLLYNDFHLPEGGRVFIYSQDRQHLIGAFTSRNNKSDRIFATGLIYGETVVLEYLEPKEVVGQSALSISHVVHGYRYVNPVKASEKGFNDSGDCNIDVVCSQGDDWRDEIKSVALILVGGGRICTGWLVNNTAQDCRPLFLTANHCLVGGVDAVNSPGANTWSFMWRYESPDCDPSVDGPTGMTTSGATLLANPGSPGDIVSSDFALFELAEDPGLAGYGVYYAGFDAGGATPQSVTGIHHPRGDVKKISMENNTLSGTTYGSNGGSPATHWRVGDWDSGTTEKGSSGSPIFDNSTQRSLGFLSGGAAACGNDAPDWYGQIAHAWNNGSASDSRRRLRDHLDPLDLGDNTFLNGSENPCGDPCVNDFEEPDLTCPPNHFEDADKDCNFTLPDYREMAGPTDNCTDGFTVEQTPAPGQVVSLGATEVTITATDASGNETACSFTVTVTDETAPVIVGQNITAVLDAMTGTVEVTAAEVDDGTYDNCYTPALSLTPNTFDCGDLGENIVTFSAMDEAGNGAAESFVITVVDETPPVVLTQDITVQLDVNTGMAVVAPSDVDDGSYDNCSIETLTLSPNTFGCEDLGENTVTLRAEDGSGNDASETAVVTVIPYEFSVDAGDCQWVYYGYEPEECTGLSAMVTGGKAPFTYEWSNEGTMQTIEVCPMVTTTYTVLVTDDNGCTATDEVTVEAIDVRCGKNLDKVEICHISRGLTRTLCVAAESVPAHLAHGDQLAACGTMPCDMESLSGLNGFSPDLPAGAGQAKEPGFELYPNPASEVLFVSLHHYGEQEVFLTVMNSLGQPVRDVRTGAGPHATERIGLDGLSSGVYLLSVRTEEEGVRVKKFILK